MAGMIGASPDDNRLLGYAKERLYLSLTVNTQFASAKLYLGKSSVKLKH